MVSLQNVTIKNDNNVILSNINFIVELTKSKASVSLVNKEI